MVTSPPKRITLEDLAAMCMREFTSIRETMATKADLADLEGRMNHRFTLVDERFDKMDARFDRMEDRFDHMEIRFDHLEGRFDRLEDKA